MRLMSSGKGRVLVVDDAESVCLAVSTMLQNQGFEVLAARNSEDALSQARMQPVSVAVIDVHLGSGSGLDLAEVMLEEMPELTVVAMSGSVMLDEELRGHERLANVALLRKPFTRRELVETIRKALAKAA
jgi:DNA-binding NtrC family response regulator